jgi:hypothetical protein
MTYQKTIASPRQKKAAIAILNNLVSDHPASFGKILKNVGYGFSYQNSPKQVLESKGFKVALAELGLTEDLITTALVSDINGKPKNRIQELKLGAEILGMVKREEQNDKPKVNTTYNFIFNEQTQREIKEMESKIKERLINGNV